MDKILTVLEEALEAGGYEVTLHDLLAEDFKIRELFVTDSQRDEPGPHFILTVEYA